MSQHAILYPRQQVPALEAPLVGGGTFKLADEKPEHFTMVVFYRGLHCPICATYLGDLHNRLDALAEKGVSVIVLSSDNEERATEAKQKWNLPNLRLGYGISLDTARAWGLFISTGRGKTSIGVEEPALFSEPALYLVRPNGELYFGTVQTMPFARPAFGDIVKALDFVIAKDYPGRGEVIDHAAAAE